VATAVTGASGARGSARVRGWPLTGSPATLGSMKPSAHPARLVCLAVALSFAALLAPGTLRADQPGVLFTEAGLHFFLPFGFELSSTEVRGWDGPVQLVLLEPRDGVVAGQPNSAFVSLSVHHYDIAPSAALERVVDELTLVFGGSGADPVEVEPTEVVLAGERRAATRLSFAVMGIGLEGTAAAFRGGGLTVVAYVQGQPDELAVLEAVFGQILESVGVGPASPPPPPTPVPAPRPGTGEGTGARLESSEPDGGPASRRAL
jgi:hypothetical protein